MARPSRTRRKRSADYQAPASADRARSRRREIKPVGQPKSQAGAYLWVADLALSRFVRDVLLNL